MSIVKSHSQRLFGPMLGLFSSRPFDDPRLGRFVRSGGRWRGSLALDGKTVPLALAGPRTAPDPAALAAAAALPEVWLSNRAAVVQAFAGHLAPCREALVAGDLEPSERPLPATDDPGALWSAAEVQSASVTPRSGRLISEVALSVSWDPEHTLGARFDGLTFVELNGSVLPE